MLFAIENLPYWIFLGTGALLFGLVIVAGGGDDDVDADVDADFDADFDVDVDADLDIDIDAGLDADVGFDGVTPGADFDAVSSVNVDSEPVGIGADADSDTGNGIAVSDILGWLGVGKAPIILLLALDLCLWGVLGWMTNVIVGGLLGRMLSNLLGLPILLGTMAIALTLGGQIARPIGKVFASFGESASADRLVGCVGTVSSARLHKVSAGKIAQVDVVDPAKNLVTINAVLPLWVKLQPKLGEKVLVIERSDKAYLYFVVAKDSADEEQWFSTIARAKHSHQS